MPRREDKPNIEKKPSREYTPPVGPGSKSVAPVGGYRDLDPALTRHFFRKERKAELGSVAIPGTYGNVTPEHPGSPTNPEPIQPPIPQPPKELPPIPRIEL